MTDEERVRLEQASRLIKEALAWVRSNADLYGNALWCAKLARQEIRWVMRSMQIRTLEAWWKL